MGINLPVLTEVYIREEHNNAIHRLGELFESQDINDSTRADILDRLEDNHEEIATFACPDMINSASGNYHSIRELPSLLTAFIFFGQMLLREAFTEANSAVLILVSAVAGNCDDWCFEMETYLPTSDIGHLIFGSMHELYDELMQIGDVRDSGSMRLTPSVEAACKKFQDKFIGRVTRQVNYRAGWLDSHTDNKVYSPPSSPQLKEVNPLFVVQNPTQRSDPMDIDLNASQMDIQMEGDDPFKPTSPGPEEVTEHEEQDNHSDKLDDTGKQKLELEAKIAKLETAREDVLKLYHIQYAGVRNRSNTTIGVQKATLTRKKNAKVAAIEKEIAELRKELGGTGAASKTTPKLQLDTRQTTPPQRHSPGDPYALIQTPRLNTSRTRAEPDVVIPVPPGLQWYTIQTAELHAAFQALDMTAPYDVINKPFGEFRPQPKEVALILHTNGPRKPATSMLGVIIKGWFLQQGVSEKRSCGKKWEELLGLVSRSEFLAHHVRAILMHDPDTRRKRFYMGTLDLFVQSVGKTFRTSMKNSFTVQDNILKTLLWESQTLCPNFVLPIKVSSGSATAQKIEVSVFLIDPSRSNMGSRNSVEVTMARNRAGDLIYGKLLSISLTEPYVLKEFVDKVSQRSASRMPRQCFGITDTGNWDTETLPAMIPIESQAAFETWIEDLGQGPYCARVILRRKVSSKGRNDTPPTDGQSLLPRTSHEWINGDEEYVEYLDYTVPSWHRRAFFEGANSKEDEEGVEELSESDADL